MNKIVSIFIMTFVIYIGGQYINLAEAVPVDAGKYTVYTESIKFSKGIYTVRFKRSDGIGSPMFSEFTKVNGDWKFRDAAGKGKWSSVSDYKEMNDVLYVVLNKYKFE